MLQYRCTYYIKANAEAEHLKWKNDLRLTFSCNILLQALYENMLVELPLASFFLSKLLGQKSANVDIDHLQSLDPMLYKNLLYLKNYDGDVQDLGLDFTIGKAIL